MKQIRTIIVFLLVCVGFCHGLTAAEGAGGASNIVSGLNEFAQTVRMRKGCLISNNSIEIGAHSFSVSNAGCYYPVSDDRYNITEAELTDLFQYVMNMTDGNNAIEHILMGNFACLGMTSFDCSQEYFAKYGNDSIINSKFSEILRQSDIILTLEKILNSHGYKIEDFGIELLGVIDTEKFRVINNIPEDLVLPEQRVIDSSIYLSLSNDSPVVETDSVTDGVMLLTIGQSDTTLVVGKNEYGWNTYRLHYDDKYANSIIYVRELRPHRLSVTLSFENITDRNYNISYTEFMAFLQKVIDTEMSQAPNNTIGDIYIDYRWVGEGLGVLEQRYRADGNDEIQWPDFSELSCRIMGTGFISDLNRLLGRYNISVSCVQVDTPQYFPDRYYEADSMFRNPVGIYSNVWLLIK